MNPHADRTLCLWTLMLIVPHAYEPLCWWFQGTWKPPGYCSIAPSPGPHCCIHSRCPHSRPHLGCQSSWTLMLIRLHSHESSCLWILMVINHQSCSWTLLLIIRPSFPWTFLQFQWQVVISLATPSSIAALYAITKQIVHTTLQTWSLRSTLMATWHMQHTWPIKSYEHKPHGNKLTYQTSI